MAHTVVIKWLLLVIHFYVRNKRTLFYSFSSLVYFYCVWFLLGEMCIHIHIHKDDGPCQFYIKTLVINTLPKNTNEIWYSFVRLCVSVALPLILMSKWWKNSIIIKIQLLPVECIVYLYVCVKCQVEITYFLHYYYARVNVYCVHCTCVRECVSLYGLIHALWFSFTQTFSWFYYTTRWNVSFTSNGHFYSHIYNMMTISKCQWCCSRWDGNRTKEISSAHQKYILFYWK